MEKETVVNQPMPRKSLEAAPYWDGLQKKELRYQFCQACSKAVFHPRQLCPYCLSSELEWRVSKGKAKIYSYSVIYRPLFPEWKSPYILGIVQLEEDFYMFTEIVECSAEQVKIDMAVQVVFHPISSDTVLPKFRPV